jgi:hypothetical protein
MGSFHEAKTVWMELWNLCLPFASNNSYCIVEDTVLKSPMDALRNFWRTEESKDFCIDSDREFMGITQHRGGYIRRTDTKHRAQPDAARQHVFARTFKENYIYKARDQFGNLVRQKYAMDIATTAFLQNNNTDSAAAAARPVHNGPRMTNQNYSV